MAIPPYTECMDCTHEELAFEAIALSQQKSMQLAIESIDFPSLNERLLIAEPIPLWALDYVKNLAREMSRFQGQYAPDLDAIAAIANHHFGSVSMGIEASGTMPKKAASTPTAMSPPVSKMLTPVLRQAWEALDRNIMDDVKLAVSLGLTPSRGGSSNARKRVQRLRGMGFVVEHQMGKGYYRPDAPPPTSAA